MAQQGAEMKDKKDSTTLERMADFDFSAPVEINVIFDDCDDDIKIKKEIIDLIDDDVDDSLKIKSEDCNDNEDNSAPKPKQQEEINIKNENTVDKNNNIETENIAHDLPLFKKSLKRKQDVDPSISVDDAKKQYSGQNNTEETYNASEKLNQNHPSCEKLPGDSEICKTSCNDLNVTTDINVIDVDEYQRPNVYIVNLLQMVAESLILILDDYWHYSQIKNNISIRQTDIDHYKQSFFRLKHNYFNLMYSTVDTIILPQIENQNFVDKFFKDAYALVTENNRPITISDIRSLFFELLDFSKEKKKILQDVRKSRKKAYAFITNPLLRQHLIAPSKNINNTPNSPEVQTKSLPTPNPASQNVSNCVQATASAPTCHNNVTRNSDDNVLFSCKCMTIKRISDNDSKKTTTTSKPHNANVNPNGFSFGSQREYLQRNSTNLNAPPNNIGRNVMGSNNQNNCKAPPPYCSNTVTFTIPNPALPPRIFNHSSINNINAQPERRVIMPMQVTPAHQSSPREQQNGETVRSVSTDSGIMSPPPYPSDIVKEVAQSAVPSLPPQAQLIPEGWCYVCGVATRQMCIGCYRRYYCSTTCQHQDWQTHMIACRATVT